MDYCLSEVIKTNYENKSIITEIKNNNLFEQTRNVESKMELS